MNKKITKKVEHIMTTICNSSAVDRDNNSLSLFNIIEEINVDFKSDNNQPINFSEKKAVTLPFELISVWKRLDNSTEISKDMKIIFYDPDRVVMQELPYKLEIKNPHQRMRVRIKGNGLNITRQGEYYFSIQIKNDDLFEEVIKVPVFVKISSPVPSDLRILKK